MIEPPTAEHAAANARRQFLTAFAVAIVIAVPHIVASRGYTTVPWGDYGRWLHETERFANGEVLYRDFTWPFPPLALWLLGSWMKVFGAGLAPVHAMMSLVLVAILGCYTALVARTVRPELVKVVVAASVVLALALAQRESASLALGMYSPAAPIAILLLLLALLIRLDMATMPSRGREVLLGALCGAMVLTKQDVWLPAAFLSISYRSFVTPLVASVTVTAGVGVIAGTAGADVLPGVFTGFNHLQELGGLGLPEPETLTLAVIAAAGAGAVLTIVTGAAARWWVPLMGVSILASGAYLTLGSRAGGAGYVGVIGDLARGLLTQVPPLLLPVGLAVAVVVRRARVPNAGWLLGLLALICLTRARRGFQFAEWYHALLELPVYAMVVLALVPGVVTIRRLRLVFMILLMAGLAAEWTLGRVPLAGLERLPAVSTVRGTVHWRPYEVERMQWLSDELQRHDPGGKRPLFAFGYTAGYSYFLDRKNPTGMPQGFRLSRFDADSVVRALLISSPPIFALDSHEYDSATVPARGIQLATWRRPRVINHYMRYDRSYFEALVRQCEQVSTYPESSSPLLVLYSCGRTEQR